MVGSIGVSSEVRGSTGIGWCITKEDGQIRIHQIACSCPSSGEEERPSGEGQDGGWRRKRLIGQIPQSLPHMYRSSRSVTRTVSSGRLFHSSPLCLNTVQPKPAPAKPVEPPGEKDCTRPDGPVLSERLQEATSLLRGYITKAAGDTAINVRKRADGFTAVTQALFSELGGQLNRATGYEDIELLKKKVEAQGTSSLTPFSIGGVARKFTVANLF